MRNTFKNSWGFIFILVVSFILPFNVEAKQKNTYVLEYKFDDEELISGDTIHINDATTYIPIEEQDFRLYNEYKVTKFEYYIIDNIDSNGNIKYKKYDFTNSNKNIWNPESSTLYDLSGAVYDFFPDTVEYYSICKYGLESFDYSEGCCNIVLPAVNGKVVRWKFDSKENVDKKNIDICKFQDKVFSSDIYYSSCDKIDSDYNSTYAATYEYYTSSVYRFYQVPDETPKVNVTCDSNKLSAGGTAKCKVNASSKYALSNILFDITSDKLKISNLQFDDYWEYYSDYWDSKEIDNGYSINFTYVNSSGCDYPYYCGDPGGFKYLFDFSFNENPVVATFDVTSDEDIDDVVSSLKTTNFKYVDKTGENTIPDDKDDSDNKISNILNPSTFRNSYYLVIGILIIGGICFIQLRSKKKSK